MEEQMNITKPEGAIIPLKVWADDIEEGAMSQINNLLTLPFAFHHVAIMPDVHQGYGMPIGGVLATRGVVVPNACGVDLGCGLLSVQTSIKNISTEELKLIMTKIRELVPLGFEHQKEEQEWIGFNEAPDVPIVMQQLQAAKKQLGTLGGGNHFIELQKGSDGFIWVMIHSGSRNFGLKIAHEYNRKAQMLCSRWYSNIPSFKGEDGLAFFPIETKEGKEYMDAMNYALYFAYANRLHMLENVKKAIYQVVDCKFEPEINIHHNYATWENHFGANVIVHRKGATSARKDQTGIIPGSQGTSSYIVRGLGNPESFMSCSHGAGRTMSRTAARKSLNLESEKKMLDDQGIIHSIRSVKDLDEASSAYKDIDEVMENQKDLVEIVTKLNPLAVIKG